MQRAARNVERVERFKRRPSGKGVSNVDDKAWMSVSYTLAGKK
jgi:hypothetical protein